MSLAHVFIGDRGPGAGFMHPLSGLDHLIAMYTVGLLSASIGGRSIWTVPATFVATMAAGGVAGLVHLALPGADYGVALSVILLGVALAAGRTLPVPWVHVATAAFGMYHGYAHGVEMPRVSSPALYVVGFMAATAGLHLLGVVSGLLVQCRSHADARLRVCGAAISAVGFALALQLR